MRGHRDDQNKDHAHVMDESGGSTGYAILGIQQRKKQRKMKRKMKTHCFSHVGQPRRYRSHSWSREQGWKVSSREMPAEFLWSGRTRWKRRRSRVKVGVGQTEAKLAGLREEAGAERNLKSQGRRDFTMKNIAFSQNGASLVKVEENGSTGLAPKMPPTSRYKDPIQAHQVLGLASAFRAMGCSVCPDTKVDHPTRVMLCALWLLFLRASRGKYESWCESTDISGVTHQADISHWTEL